MVHQAIDQGVHHADRYLLDVATPLFDTHDMQHAVNLLLTHGAREFIAGHRDLVSFEGR